MDTKALRQKILDLAIHGRLVPQDPNDEPASVLLERIHAEKEQLIKEGKIKKPKKSTKTADKPYYAKTPFEVPKGWEWTTLGEISNYGACKNIETKDIPQDAWILELEDIEKDSARIIRKYTRKEREAKGIRHSFAKGDVLYSKLRTYLNKVLVAPEDGYCTPEIIPITCCPSINPLYLNFVLRSKYFLSYTALCGYGVKMPRLSTEDACNGMIPLPPRKEQNRIVSYARRLFKAINSLDESQIDLQAAIKQAKSKILDLAIHGKLVPQDPNDEPASELLHRINPKAAPMCDTGQYGNLPKEWIIIKVGDVAKYTNGRAFKPEEWETQGKPIVRIQNLNDKYAPYNYSTLDYERKYLIKRGDLLFAWAASLGTYIWHGEGAWLNQHIFKVEPYAFIDKYFLYYSFMAMVSEFYKESHGSGMVHVTKRIFEDTPLWLPPLQEQKRIVARIEELYSVIDKIASSLQN